MPKRSAKSSSSSTKVKKSKLAGLDYTDRKIRSLSHQGELQTDIIKASNLSTIHEDHKIVFNIHTGPRWIKFLKKPLLLTYLMFAVDDEGNEKYITAREKLSADKNSEYTYPYMVNPCLLGSNFFDDYRLFINNCEIPINANMRRDQAFVQKMNRTFATDKDRQNVGIRKNDWISTLHSSSGKESGFKLLSQNQSTKPTAKYMYNYAEIPIDAWFPLGPSLNFASEKLKTDVKGGKKIEDELFFPPWTHIMVGVIYPLHVSK